MEEEIYRIIALEQFEENQRNQNSPLSDVSSDDSSTTLTYGYRLPVWTFREASPTSTFRNPSPTSTLDDISITVTTGDQSPMSTSDDRSPTPTSEDDSRTPTSDDRSPSITLEDDSEGETYYPVYGWVVVPKDYSSDEDEEWFDCVDEF